MEDVYLNNCFLVIVVLDWGSFTEKNFWAVSGKAQHCRPKSEYSNTREHCKHDIPRIWVGLVSL